MTGRDVDSGRRSRPTALVAGLLAAGMGWADELTVCPTDASGSHCSFAGAAGIQQAVDQARDGDTVRLRAGRYGGEGYRDVRFDELTIRGRVVVEGKSVTLSGETGTVLDAGAGDPASMLVVHRGDLTLRHVSIANARAASAEDDVYDGHGLFVVHGTARLDDVTFRSIEKMALSIRGRSSVQARGVRLLDGHVGVWIEEHARLQLQDCVIANNDSAAVAAYADATVDVSGCVFESNLDDGLYAAERARIHAVDSLFVRNAPYAVRSVDAGRITVTGSMFYGDAAVSNDPGSSGPAIRSSRIFAGNSRGCGRGYCSVQDERQVDSSAAGSQ